MRLIKSALALFTVLSCCAAIAITECSLKTTIGGQLKQLKIDIKGDNSGQWTSNLPLEGSSLTDSFQLSVKTDRPVEHASLLIGIPSRSVETPVKPKISQNEYSFHFVLSDMPAALLFLSKTQHEPLVATLIMSSSEEPSNKNIFESVFQLTIPATIEAEYEIPEKFGAKSEIQHEFRPQPKMAPAFLAKTFALAIVCCLFVLVGAWFITGSIAMDNIPSSASAFISFAVLMAAILAYELIFTRYYMGANIFETLLATFYISLPALLFGTKFLRSFGKTI